jgi:hypothetical protein
MKERAPEAVSSEWTVAIYITKMISSPFPLPSNGASAQQRVSSQPQTSLQEQKDRVIICGYCTEFRGSAKAIQMFVQHLRKAHSDRLVQQKQGEKFKVRQGIDFKFADIDETVPDQTMEFG